MTHLVSTQIHENYGAHDWDGTGDCPSHWKAKGGEDYIILGSPSMEDAEHFVSYRVCSSDDYSIEEVVSAHEVAEDHRTEMEKYFGDDHAVRIDWDKRFMSRYCRGGWSPLSVSL